MKYNDIQINSSNWYDLWENILFFSLLIKDLCKIYVYSRGALKKMVYSPIPRTQNNFILQISH